MSSSQREKNNQLIKSNQSPWRITSAISRASNFSIQIQRAEEENVCASSGTALVTKGGSTALEGEESDGSFRRWIYWGFFPPQKVMSVQ